MKTNKQSAGLIVALLKDPDEDGLEYGLVQVDGSLELYLCKRQKRRQMVRLRLKQTVARWLIWNLKTFAETGKLK